MNLSDEFWKRSEFMSEEDIRKGKMGVGIDLDGRKIVMFTGEDLFEVDVDMAEAMSAALMMCVDALRNHIAKSN